MGDRPDTSSARAAPNGPRPAAGQLTSHSGAGSSRDNQLMAYEPTELSNRLKNGVYCEKQTAYVCLLMWHALLLVILFSLLPPQAS